jgi:hypothetical protein
MHEASGNIGHRHAASQYRAARQDRHAAGTRRARGAAIGKGSAIVDEQQQRPVMALSRCRLVLPVCVASAG